MKYHNNFFEKSKSKRMDLYSRLDTIKEVINHKDSLLDVGCSGGFNSFGLSDEIKTIKAFDLEKPLIDECLDIQKKYGTNINFSVNNLTDYLDNNNETFDIILYLSTHHHIIKQYGMERAKEILNDLFSRCKMMVFDMGQKDENCSEHQWWRLLPETNNIEEWSFNYLKDSTSATKVKKIGFTKIHNTKRLLWKIEK